MNIIHLEGAIGGLIKMQSKERTEIGKQRYVIWINEYRIKLEQLTKGADPHELIIQLLKSQRE